MLFKRKIYEEINKRTHQTTEPEMIQLKELKSVIFCENQKSPQKAQKKETFKIFLQEKRGLSRILLRNPQLFPHVFNFCNLIGINENSLKYKDYDESYLTTMFQIKSVQKIDIKETGIILNLRDLKRNQFPLSYIVERYKSFGDHKFYSIACLLEDLDQTLGQFQTRDQIVFDTDRSESLPNFLQNMQNKLYFSNLSGNRSILSNSLLTFLDYNIDHFAIEALKYRTVQEEIVSSEFYYEVTKKSLENLNLLLLLFQNKLSKEQFKEQSVFEFNDYLISKGKKRYYCQLKLHFPTLLGGCIEVVKVISEQEQLDYQYYMTPGLKKKLKIEIDRIQHEEGELLQSLIKVPYGIKPENCSKMASYQQIQTTHQ